MRGVALRGPCPTGCAPRGMLHRRAPAIHQRPPGPGTGGWGRAEPSAAPAPPRSAPGPSRAERSRAEPRTGGGQRAPCAHGELRARDGGAGGGSRGGAVGNPWVSASSAGVPRGGCRCSGSLSCCSPPLPRSPVTCAGGAPGRLGGSWEPTPWGALPVGDGEGNGALRQLSCPAFPTGHQPVTVNFSSPVGQLPLLLLQPVSGACGGWREADKGSP